MKLLADAQKCGLVCGLVTDPQQETHTMSLKDTQLKNIKPTNKIQKLPDGGGLNLVVFPSGGKIWKLRYRWHGKEQTYTIGEYPRISLGEARKQREELKALIRKGVNPNQAKQEEKAKLEQEQKAEEEKQAHQFSVVAISWLDGHKDSVTSKRVQKIQGMLNNHINPILGNMDIRAITGLHIEEIGKAVRAKGRTNIYVDCVALVRQIIEYACTMGITDRLLPVKAVIKRLKGADNSKEEHHPHVALNELPSLLKSLEQVKSTPMVMIGLKLAMITALRQGELRASRWEYIDWEAHTLTIPSHIMKGTKKDKASGVLEHTVFLPTQAITLLEQLWAITGNHASGFLFPSRQGEGKYMSDGTLNKALRQVIPSDKQDIHGFRGLASTYLNEQHPELHAPIEKMLAHRGSQDKVKLAYDHSTHDDIRRKLWQEWGDFLEDQGMKI